MNEEFQKDLAQLMQTRRSIRAFLPQPVDRALMEKVFALANQAPSNSNTQPWRACVVSGAARDRMRDALLETVGKGQNKMDFDYDPAYEGTYRRRQIEVGKLLYQALGVERGDDEGKRRAFLRNLEFFDAPHAAFLFMPDWAGIRQAADLGMYAQNLLLAMWGHGIASCPQTILGFNADVVREQLGVGEEWKLMFGVSFGYEDKNKPENKIVPERASVDETTTFFD